MTRSSGTTWLPVAMLIVALTGCGGGSSVAPATSSSQSLSQSQQSEVAANVSNSIDDGIETGLGGAAQSISVNGRTVQSLNACITPSPNPPVINADGIPANENYTFNN